jgi:D-amino-acid oxidase
VAPPVLIDLCLMWKGRSDRKDVLVVGCGVIGLTAARRLQAAGHRVRIVARELPPETTSNRAAAVWLPFKAEPAERVAWWSQATYRACRPLAEEAASGVVFVPLTRVSRRPLEEPPWLRPDIPFRHLDAAEVPNGYSHGWRAEVPFFHARRFLAWLLAGFAAAGGEVVRREVASLAEAAEVARFGKEGVVVNCTGLGAREVVGDASMFPIRGQIAVARAPGHLEHRIDDDDEDAPAYVLPRGDGEVVLGGTAQRGDGRTEADAGEEASILARCRPLLPPAASVIQVVRRVVGLRPGRPAVRLEVEPGAAGGRPVVHDYGHGGSGFTVCWGCADEVAVLVAGL